MTANGAAGADEPMRIRKFPYPYGSALTFVSDIDETTMPSLLRMFGCFLGLEPDYDGVELEISSSFWLMAGEQNPEIRSSIYALELDGSQRSFVQGRLGEAFAGPLFDSLHTYGDFEFDDFTREHAKRCVEFAHDNGIRPKFWTFHGSQVQTQNIRPGDAAWQGDTPESTPYHLDLLHELDVPFFRMPPSLDLRTGEAERRVLAADDGSALMTVSCHATIQEAPNHGHVLEWLDQLEAREMLGVPRRQIMQGTERLPNKLLTWHPELLPFQLNNRMIESAIDAGRALYINQHLSRARSIQAYELKEVRNALRRISRLHRDGRLLVTSPSRLITFEVVRDYAVYRVQDEPERRVVQFDPTILADGWSMPLSIDDLAGVSFEHRDPRPTVLRLRDAYIPTVRETTESGRFVDRLPWETRIGELRDAYADLKQAFGDDDG